MVHFDGTFILQIINFFILLFILNKFLFEPVINNINRRREYVDGLKSEIQALSLKIETIENNYSNKLLEAERVNKAWFEEQVKQANEYKIQTLNKIKKEINDYVNEQKNLLLKEKENISNILENEINNLAKKIVYKVCKN